MFPGLTQRLLFMLIVRPLLWLLIGFRVRNRHALPAEGPAIVVANHNSHLDTLVLLSLVPGKALRHYLPAAAADTFLKPGFVGWAARRILNILPVDRSHVGADQALAPVRDALKQGKIIVLFPEGTRGEPERLARFRLGIAMLIKEFPEVPVTPVFIYGLGRALPRGTSILVPFFCDIAVGPPLLLADRPPREIASEIGRTIAALGEGLRVEWQEGPTAGEDIG